MNPPPREPRSASRSAPDLLRKRLLFVTGKGGVGKSTVSAALGLLAARRGLRTIVVELARRDDISRALGAGGASSPGQELALERNLSWTTLDPDAALAEYLTDQLPLKALAELLSSSRLFTYLAAATPGLAELLTIGKTWELAQPQRRRSGDEPYDLVIVDAPATGHGLAFLAAPSTFASVARVGPVARQARKIAAMIADPELTGIVAIATPQEMPVNELGLLVSELRSRLGLELDRVIVNGLLPRRFSREERGLLAQALDDRGDLGGGAALAIHEALDHHDRAHEQRNQLARARRIAGFAPATLPALAEPSVGRAQIEQLSERLERVV